MYLTSVTHRDELFEIATRWLADRPHPEDGRLLTEIFLYEPLIAAPVSRDFLSGIQTAVHGAPRTLHRLRSKDELRDALASKPPAKSARVDELLRHYAAAPEEFFPGTPADMLIARDEEGAVSAIVRIKRIRRIAEKASRRLADCLAGEIRGIAKGLEVRKGLAPQDAVEDAEQFVARAFHDHELELEPGELRIDDVLGFKFVADEEKQARFVAALESFSGATIVEREEHRGSYNDINLLVDIALPDPDEMVARAGDAPWESLATRGLSVDELKAGFPGYAEAGARSIRAEVILTSPEELIESEFGRSIHEERILAQRNRDTYRGPIAQNGSFLVEYLLALAVSPTLQVDELPVKIWGRYLPEYFSRELLRLFGIQKGPQLVGTYLPGL